MIYLRDRMQSYPLHWPDNQPRTPHYQIQRSRFETRNDIARQLVFEEIKRLGGKNPILSTNIPLRNDGFPRAGAKEPDDRGVAVYFDYKGKQMVFACDKWQYTKENMKAIAKTIDAIRGIERWGSSEMMDQAFRGFEALPAPSDGGWRKIFGEGSSYSPTKDELKAKYKQLAKNFHPDRGGDHDHWLMINEAYNQAKTELGF